MHNAFARLRRRESPRSRRTLGRFQLEWLEPRELLTTYLVTTTQDTAIPGSLRSVLEQVNDDTSPDLVKFAIPGSGPQTITLNSPLPQITNPVTIDGTSQPLYAKTPLIVIDGSNVSNPQSVLSISAGSTTIEGLALVNCSGNGIYLVDGGDDLVQSCYIGTADGTTAAGNGEGIISLSANNTIGGSSAGAGNVISGNTKDGIMMDGPDNLIENNVIGTTADGTSPLSNTLIGIQVQGVPDVTIIGNLVSANAESDMSIEGATGTLVQGNTIGTNLAGTAAIVSLASIHGQDGIDIQGCDDTTIGGTAAGQGNLISGHSQWGLNLKRSPDGTNPLLDDNAALVEGNIIGLNRAGTASIPNGTAGIQILNDDNSTIGGTTAAARNVISGNVTGAPGIYLGNSTGEVIEGNYIGTDITGTIALRDGDGILGGNAVDDTIGGTVAGAGNVISGNQGSGIAVGGLISPGDDLIAGNYIGVDASGRRPLPNMNWGILFTNLNGSTIGGTTAAAANVIASNAYDGISIQSSQNTVEGNYFGTDPEGDNLGNGYAGVSVVYQQNTVGGTAAGAGNVIAHNKHAGISDGGTGSEDSFLGNSIYDNAWLGISLGDGHDPTPNNLDEATVPPSAFNNGQNYPVLTSAYILGSSTEISGTLNAAANTQYVVQFYASPQPDPSGYGQGQLYLGSGTATTGTGGDDANDVNFELSVPTAAPPGWFVSATATDPGGDTSEFSQDVPAQAIADLAVAFEDLPLSVTYVGEALPYVVKVSDNGPAAANGVIFTDTLPQNITASVTATTSVGGVTPVISAGVVTADFGVMAANSSATVTIVVHPNAAAVPQIVDEASVTSQAIDPDPSNNHASLSIPIEPAADLAMSLQATPAVVYFGDSVTYTLAAANYGLSPAANVVVTDTLPAGIGPFVTATTSVAGVTPAIGGGQVIVDLGTLASGTTVTVTITVQTTIAAVPQITDSATITSTTFNPNGSNKNPSPVTTPVLFPPLQVGVDWTGSAKSITSLVLYFNAPLVTSTATNPANYALVNVGRDGIFGTRDDQTVSLLAPVYDAADWTVTLVPVKPLAVNQFYHLLVNGVPPGGVTDTVGARLSGAGPGQPGTDYTAMLAQGTKLRYDDSKADKVTITITKGGYLKDLLSATGNGARLVVVGEHPRHTVLAGKVTRAKHKTSEPTLGYTIYGLGQFGDVLVSMTSPPFLVARYPFSPGPPIPVSPAPLVRLGGTVATPAAAAEKPRSSTRAGFLGRATHGPVTSPRARPGPVHRPGGR